MRKCQERHNVWFDQNATSWRSTHTYAAYNAKPPTFYLCRFECSSARSGKCWIRSPICEDVTKNRATLAIKFCGTRARTGCSSTILIANVSFQLSLEVATLFRNDKLAWSFRECQCDMLVVGENLWHKRCTNFVELQIFNQNFLYFANANTDSFRYHPHRCWRSCITDLCTASMFSSVHALFGASDLG